MSTASQYMDKQIMDLSNSQSGATFNNKNSGSNHDFIDFMNRSPEKKEDIVPSYDFMPIRPAVGSSSPPAARSSNFDSVEDDAPLSSWNSVDSKANTSPIRNYGSVDAGEAPKFILGENRKPSSMPSDNSLFLELDKKMKKYMDNLTHAVDGMSTKLSQLDTRTRSLENSIDDLKVSVGNNHGDTDGKMRLLENVLREVQTSVLVIKDKQEILEGRLEITKLHVPKVEQEVESKNIARTDSIKTGVPAHQQFSSVPVAQPPPTLHSSNVHPPPQQNLQPPPTLPSSNVPPPPQQNLQPPPTLPSSNVPPPPQQNLQPQVQIPSQLPQNQVPSVPQRESYFPPPSQVPENSSQQYQMPPPQPQQPQHQPAPPPPQPQYQSPPPQYSQSAPPSQQHPSFSAVNPAIPQPQLRHHPEETSYALAQTHSPGIHLPPSHPSTGVHPPPSQQYYGHSPNPYEPPSNRPGQGYSSSFGPSLGPGESYPYINSPSQHGSGFTMKPQQLTSPGMGQSGGSGHPQLPAARILPQALPTASAVGGASVSGSSGSKVPIDDVVDRVTSMGFPRDQVWATVRRLTENGQAVDLNVVLDKLMNDGEGQVPRGWLGQ